MVAARENKVVPLERGRTRPARPASSRPPAPELTDEQAVVLASQGDLAAFEVLYRRHAGFAMQLAVRIQGHDGDVDDIVHDAFIQAHRRLYHLREAVAFRAWLGSIVVRLVRTRLRRHRMLSRLGFSTQEPAKLDAIVSRDVGQEVRAQLAQVYALLQTIPTDDRIAWVLRNVEHHRLEEVAALCQCSLATAKRRIARATRFLDDHFVATATGELR